LLSKQNKGFVASENKKKKKMAPEFAQIS